MCAFARSSRIQEYVCPSRRWIVLSLSWLIGVVPAFPAVASALPETQTLKGEVLNQQNVPLGEASCTLTAPLLPAGGVSVRTSPKGEFQFSGLVPGTYDLICAAVGYEPVEKGDIEVTDTPPPSIEVVLPGEVVMRQTVEVREKAPGVTQQSGAPPATLTAPQIMRLPLVEEKFKAALPLIPGVVRTPNGVINIKGVPENEGLLLVNSAQLVDPVTGSFAIDIPIDSIGALHVYKGVYGVEYGDFSGGLTTIETKAPSGQWHAEVQDVTPNPRIKAGQLVGIADFTPRLYFSGPLLKDKLNLSEEFEYDLDKQPVRGLAWPHNEMVTHAFNTFTSLQYIFSPRHLLTLHVSAYPLRRRYANINSLQPQPTSSDYGQQAFSIEYVDRFLFKSGAVLTSVGQGQGFDSNVHGQGPLDMLVMPNGWGGNFFNTSRRQSDQEEVRETLELPQKEGHGKHGLTLGGGFIHRSYRGASRSRPVRLLRPDGSVAERIDFSGAGSLAARDTEAVLFINDHWQLGERLALDTGLRYSGRALADSADFAPRLGVVYSPGSSSKTVLRTGFGLFYGRAALLGSSFTQNPTRVVSIFDENETLVGTPLSFRNTYRRGGNQGFAVEPVPQHLDSVPLNLTWNVEADRVLRPSAVLRLSFLGSRTYDQYFVDPVQRPDTGPALLLSGRGGSRYHAFESTLHVTPNEGSELNFSYVYSRSRGDLNTLDQIFVPFEQPVIRPNAFARLPSDIPHRFIGWGLFKAHVWGLFLGPVVDWHSGFPYSNIDVLQNYVGVPDSQRFPRFFSLDLKIGREFELSLPLVRNHLLRGALTIFNITNHNNPRDVFSNVASPFFGQFAGFQHRFLGTSLAVIY